MRRARTRALVAAACLLALVPVVAQAQSVGLRSTQALNAEDEEANFAVRPRPRPDATAEQDEAAGAESVDPFADVPERLERSQRDRRAADERRRRPDAEDDALATGTVAIIETEDDSDTAPGRRAERVGPASERAAPVESRSARRDDDPFAAPGLRMGSFILRPSVESGIQAETTQDEGADALTSVFSENTARLLMSSDWSRHAAEIDAFVRSRQRLSGTAPNETEIGIDGNVRLDLGYDTTATVAAGYNRSPEDPATSATTSAAVNRPVAHRFNASATLRHRIGPAFGQAQASIRHESFGDAELADGTTRSQADLDNTLVLAQLRAGYALSEAISPFIEAEIGRRTYTQTPDAFGFSRDATRYGLRAGVELDLGEKVGGEFAVGWLAEDISDPSLEDIGALRLDGRLAWSPRRGTTVNLSGSTTVQGSSTGGESGAILYTGSIGVSHQARANLTTTATVTATQRDVLGTSPDTLSLSAETGFTWWFSRYLGLSGRVRHERVLSDAVSERSTSNSAFLGLKLQR